MHISSGRKMSRNSGSASYKEGEDLVGPRAPSGSFSNVSVNEQQTLNAALTPKPSSSLVDNFRECEVTDNGSSNSAAQSGNGLARGLDGGIADRFEIGGARSGLIFQID